MFHLTCPGWLVFCATPVRQIQAMLHSPVTDLSRPSVDVVHAMLQVILYTAPMLLVQLLLRRAMTRTGRTTCPSCRAPACWHAWPTPC